MIVAHLRGAIAVPLILMTFSLSMGRAQPPGVRAASGSGVVSPAVVATWFTHREPAGGWALELLVLWRGTPGWFMAGGGSGGSGGGSSPPSAVEGQRGPEVQRLFFGGLRLEVRFDPVTGTAQIQDEVIALQGVNVILVDEVDSARGLRIAGTEWVDPQLPESPVQIEAVVRRSPELFSFLRCDTQLPDPQAQSMLDLRCAQMRGQ
jgi:hypothetical protein